MSQYNPLVQAPQVGQELMIQHMQRCWESHAQGKGNICWTVSYFPVPLLMAFDINLFLPEMDSAFTAYAKADVMINSVAEGAGYSRDLCSYAKLNIGKMLQADLTPEQGAFPPPDFLVTCRSACTTFVQWFETVARHYDVPLFVLDVPVWDVPEGGQMTKVEVDYFIERSQDLIHFLEEVTGTPFEKAKYEQAVEYERKAIRLAKEIYKYTKRTPSPVSEWDLMGTVMPALINWRCQPLGIQMLESVKSEVEERIAQGVTALSNEKHRLLFISNPPWYKVHEIQEWLAERDTVFVCSGIGDAFSGAGDYTDMPSLCTVMTKHWPNWTLKDNIRHHQRLAEEWNCDGIVLMDNRACKPIAFPMVETAAAIEDELGIPCLRFEGNMADSRDLDDQAVREQFNAFIDLLEDR